MNNLEGYDDYNVFIRQCVRQLLEDRVCYCYSEEHIEDIRERMLKKYNLKIHSIKNDCGYTLSIRRNYEKERNN